MKTGGYAAIGLLLVLALILSSMGCNRGVIDADLLDGIDSAAFAAAVHSHDAEYVNEDQADSVDSAMISDGSIAAADIADGAVGTADLADDAVTSAKLATDAVGSTAIANGAVDTDKIADDAVTSDKIDDDAVGSDTIIDGEVGSADLADDAVTSTKIADNAVGATNISDEPGISFTKNEEPVDITATATWDSSEIDGVPMTVPAAGWIMVQVDGTIRFTANDQTVYVGVSDDDDTVDASTQISISSALPDTVYYRNFAVSYVYTVSAGSYDFYLNARSSDTTRVEDYRVTAIYFPTDYGV